MKPIDILAIEAFAKKETAKAVQSAMPILADMVQSAVDAKEIKTIADTAITIKGDKGDKGDAGLDGKDGRDGKDGINGRDGKDGANGKDGKDGKDAASKDGKDGRNGANGKDGVGVAEVAIGDDGHLYVGLSNGKVIDAGKARGDDGKPGKDGKTIIGGGGGSSKSASGTVAWDSITGKPEFAPVFEGNAIPTYMQDNDPEVASPYIWFRTSGGAVIDILAG